MAQCVSVIYDAEKLTTLLGAEKRPTIHLIDVVLSSVVRNLRVLDSTTPPGDVANVLREILRTSVMERRISNIRQFPMVQTFCQVAGILTSGCRNLSHMAHLSPYTETEEKSALIIYDMLSCL